MGKHLDEMRQCCFMGVLEVSMLKTVGHVLLSCSIGLNWAHVQVKFLLTLLLLNEAGL